MPADPSSLADLCAITRNWANSGNFENLRFLIHDSGPISSDRIMLLGTYCALRHLSDTDVWYMDGTFATWMGHLLHEWDICYIFTIVPTIICDRW